MHTKIQNVLDEMMQVIEGTVQEDRETADAANCVTRGMMRERAVELAVMHGRLPHEATKSDWESAKRDLRDKR